MKLGIIARMDQSGLGYQTKGYYDNLKPSKTLVVDISSLEHVPERRMRQHPEWYKGKGVTFVEGIPAESDLRAFLEGLDVVLIAESAYNMLLYRISREMGVKTAVAFNWEFFDWGLGSIWASCVPDLFIAPTSWHYDEAKAVAERHGSKVVHLHNPVDTGKAKRRYVDRVTEFVHIAGRPAFEDRNGTETFLEAVRMSDGDLKGIVYTQDKALETRIKADYPEITAVHNAQQGRLYRKGGVLVLPRRYGGNCLPMGEALAAGMPVVMPDISPNDDLLPRRWLVPAHEKGPVWNPRPGVNVQMYETEPAELMFRMRWFASLPPPVMLDHSNMAAEIAATVSWRSMRDDWLEALEAITKL